MTHNLHSKSQMRSPRCITSHSCTGSSLSPWSPSHSSTSRESRSPSTCRPPPGRSWTPWGRCSSGWRRCSFTSRMRDGTCRHSRISSGFSLQVWVNSDSCWLNMNEKTSILKQHLLDRICLCGDGDLLLQRCAHYALHQEEKREKKHRIRDAMIRILLGLWRAINGCKLDFQF